MRKKALASLLLSTLLTHFFWIPNTHAAFAVSSFSINATNSSDYYFNPGDSFSIDAFGQNDAGEDVENVLAKVNFSDNSNFSYVSTEQKTGIQFVDTFNPVPLSDYSSSTGLSTPVSNSSVANGNYLMLLRTNNNFGAFQIDSNISSFSNSINVSFDAQKVSDSSSVTGNVANRNIFVNVKPHITSKYFEKSGSTVTTLKSGGAESIDLIVEVKDYNGCSNIDGGSVTADLSALGLSSSEALSYESCLGDGQTVRFKKTGISTLAGLGDITFQSSNFSTTDEDGNTHNPSDANFAESGESDSLLLTITSPGAPIVNNLGVTDDIIGGPSNLSSIFSFSANQSGTSKVALDSCTQSDPAKIFEDSTSYSGSTQKDITIASSDLIEGDNTIFACVDNGLGDVGSLSVNITKDTAAPSITNFSHTANITTADVTVNLTCSEDGNYQIEVDNGGGFSTALAYTSTTADTAQSPSLSNALFNLGSNTIRVSCRDEAENVSTTTGSINKIPPTPSMNGEITAFADNDIDNNGLDGRDINITWNSTIGTGFSAFALWKIYLLPSSTPLDINTHTPIKVIADSATGSFTGDTTLTTDSAGDNLIGGSSYIAYVTILGSSGDEGVEGASSVATLTADVIEQATVISAAFISDTQLQLGTDTTLSTTLGDHTANLISYTLGGSVTATSVASISDQNIILNIPSLGNGAATGTDLLVGSGALRSAVGGFNLALAPSLTITDAQDPVISSLSVDTSPVSGVFYNSDIDVSWSSSEALVSGNTQIRFTRSSGESDITHNVNITSPSLLTAGAKTTNIILTDDSASDRVALKCGSIYTLSFRAEDAAGNTDSTQQVSNIGFDNCAPEVPVPDDIPLQGEGAFNLTWSAVTDDNGNGSGVASYSLELHNGSSCASINNTFTGISGTTQSVSLTNGDYSWRLLAIDNVGNSSEYGSCDDFTVDTNVPSFSNALITDSGLGSSVYAKSGNTITVEADITNTDINNITANLASLTGDGTDTAVSCASPSSGITCSFNTGRVSYSFILGYDGTLTQGVRQANIIANNTSGINTQNQLVSITVDTTTPLVASNTITTPNGGETLGGTGTTITWNTSSITDAVGIESVDVSYYQSGILGGSICSGVNNGSCVWDFSGLSSGSDYSITLTATDFVGDTGTDSSDANFSIDLSPPVVPSNTLTIPNGGGIYAGGETLSITWNAGGITDGGGLAANPISLEYSVDNGSTYFPIVSDTANDGSFDWTLPSLNDSDLLVRLTASDSVGNTATDVSDATFTLDSTNPALTVLFAGGGGNTPQNGTFLSDSGINLTLTTGDSFMETVSYIFQNTTTGDYWNGSAYVGTLTDVTLCSDGTVGGSDNSCDSITQLISPSITQGNNYSLSFTATDEAGNSNTSSTITMSGDTTDPTLAITTTDNSYFVSTQTITGTSSDADSGISSVNISIEKDGDFWDGSSFVSGTQSLLTSTSDSFANWNYSFTPPVGDADGQNYSITVTASDAAFRTNNSSNTGIILIKDSEAPVIATDILSAPIGATVFSGGDTTSINWNNAGISDALSGLAANPIRLDYFDGSSFVLIADNLSNSGTYTWSPIPSIDSTLARIRITVSDDVGNTSFQNGDVFTIDSTPPSITNVQTLENGISNGQINALIITFSEDISDASILTSDFSIDGGSIAVTGLSTGIGSNDNQIILQFSATGDTGDTPTLQYTGTSIEDLAGRKLQNTGLLSSTDGATPRVNNLEIYDINENGKFDRIELQYSESLSSSSSLSGLTLNNALAGMSLSSASISGNTVTLTLNESDDFETAPDGLSLSLSSPVYSDSSGNNVESFSNRSFTDQAKPVIISTQTQDTDNNAKADQIQITLSEDISGANLVDFTLGNLSTGTSASSISTTDNSINITLNETSSDNDTDNAFTLAYGGTAIVDGNSNTLSTVSAYTSDDIIGPKILTRTTGDSDGNGQVDTMTIVTSEALNDDFNSLSVSVAGYSVESISSGTANDDTFILTLTEKTSSDTSATPDVRILSNTSAGDSDGNTIADEVSGTASTDGTGPVIISARYSEGDIFLVFSEDITAGTLDTSTGGAGNDFALSGGGSFAANSTTSIVSATQVQISLGVGATDPTTGVSSIGIVSGALSDSLSNVSPSLSSNNRVILSASVIINEVNFSSTANDQYIELKNLGNSSVDITGWVIENAGGNGVDLTLPAASISGNGFYLIAKVAEGSSILNVTPDRIDGALNLNSSSQNDLILTDGISTLDSALASPWPVGNASTPISMERASPAGNGMTGSNWYAAQTSTGFDTATPQGTPGSINVFDGDAPTISAQFPLDNTLLPTAGHIRFDYSDSGVGVDSATQTLTLQKWNGSTYGADSFGSEVVNTDINNTRAIYTLADLDSGRYQASFSIADDSGNTVTQQVVFYIDKFSMSVSATGVDLGDVIPGNLQFMSGEIVVTIQSVGAGFVLTQDKTGLFSQGITNLGDFDGSYGFGFDVNSDEDGVTQNYANALTAVSNNTLGNIAASTQVDGDLKTYIYRVKAGVLVGGLQEPGKYRGDLGYSVSVGY